MFSGSSVSNNQFNPSLGSSVVNYSVTDENGCSASKSIEFMVETLPTLSFGEYPDQCANSGLLELNLGVPAGGNYSGNNVQNNFFNVNAGSIGGNSFYYTYQTSNGCTDSIQGIVIVRATPTINFNTIPSTCDTTLNIQLGGVSPIGGVFEGEGVTNGIFYPSTVGVGTYVISYTLTINGCSSTAEQNLIVDDCARIIENQLLFSISPNPSTGSITILSPIPLDQIQILTVDGKMVKNLTQLESNSLTIYDLAPATYFIQLKSGELSSHYQLIVH